MAKDNKITVVLSVPIEFGSETITELVFKRPKAKHFRSMPNDPGVSDMLNLAGNICGQPTPVIDELDVEDMNKVMDVVADFIEDGPTTGK